MPASLMPAFIGGLLKATERAAEAAPAQPALPRFMQERPIPARSVTQSSSKDLPPGTQVWVADLGVARFRGEPGVTRSPTAGPAVIDEITNAHALTELLALDELARSAGSGRSVQELHGALLMAEQLAAQGIGAELLPDVEDARQLLGRVQRRPVPIGVTSGELVVLRDVLAAVHEQRALAGMAQVVSALVVLVGWRWGWVGQPYRRVPASPRCQPA
jgi:hypothetical protein